MSRAWRAWCAYWFRPAPLLDLAAVRVVAVGLQLWLLLRLDHHALFAELDGLPDALYEPLAALRLLTLPFGWRVRPSGDALHVVYWLTVAAGALALVGWRTNAALAAFTLGNVAIQAYRYSFGEIHHPEALMVLALGLLALAPAGARLSVDDLRRRLALARRERRVVEADPLAGESPFARWPLLTVRWLFALIYLSAAWSKLAASGLAWVNGYTLRVYALRDGLRWGSDLGVWLGEQHVVAVLASVGALLFEATFWLVLVVPALAVLYVPLGAAFHAGIYLVQRAPFFQFIALYSVFVPWAALAARLRGRRAARAEVLYDDRCPFCIRTATLVRALDWGDRLALGGLEARWPALAASRRDLDLDQCRREMHLLLPDGSVRRGFDAFTEIARRVPLLWPLWGGFSVPGVPAIGRRVYRWVAARRTRVTACTFEACGVDGPDGASRPADDRAGIA
ncbi:MAG TPA: DCC1-like thiol-disulfide oxidoreductase family protein [Thermodesulfobacteriota bacterium]